MRTFAIGLLLALESFAQEPPLRTHGDVLNLIDKKSVTDINLFGKNIIPLMKSGFTISHASESNQGPERVLFFAGDSGLIIGMGLDDDFVEIIDGDRTHLIPHRLSWNEKVLNEVKPSAAILDCKKCHGDPMAYIYPQYSEWPQMLGGDDDLPGPHYEATVKKIMAAPRFAGLFPKDFDPAKGHYPYRATGPRTLKNMPNFALTLGMSRQASYRLVERMKLSNGYLRYRHLLAASILNCPFAKNYDGPIKKELDKAFFPVGDSASTSLTIALMRLMDGDPLGLILPKPLVEISAKEYPVVRDQIMDFNTGLGFGEFKALILGGIYSHFVAQEREDRKKDAKHKSIWEPHLKTYRLANFESYQELGVDFEALDALIVGFGDPPQAAPNRFTQGACDALQTAVKDSLEKYPFKEPASRKGTPEMPH